MLAKVLGTLPEAGPPERSPPTLTPDSASPLNLRLSQMIAGPRAALVQRREAYAAIIEGHQATIATLEADLLKVEARLASKTNDAKNLLARKRSLVSEIDENRRKAMADTGYGAVMALLSFGATAIVGGGIAAAAGAKVVQLQGQLKDLEAQVQKATNETRTLDASLRAYQQARSHLHEQLEGLRIAHQSLEATAPVLAANAPPNEVLVHLERGVGHDERVIANLEEQITVLRTMKTQAGAYEAGLDVLIVELTGDVKMLTAQLEESRRSLFIAVVDVGIMAMGATQLLRQDGLPALAKKALLATYDFSQGNTASLITGAMNAMNIQGLIQSTGAPALITALQGLFGPESRGDYGAKVQALLQAGTAITAVQRELLGLLESVRAFDPLPLARAIIDQPKLTQAQAHIIASMLPVVL